MIIPSDIKSYKYYKTLINYMNFQMTMSFGNSHWFHSGEDLTIQ